MKIFLEFLSVMSMTMNAMKIIFIACYLSHKTCWQDKKKIYVYIDIWSRIVCFETRIVTYKHLCMNIECIEDSFDDILLFIKWHTVWWTPDKKEREKSRWEKKIALNHVQWYRSIHSNNNNWSAAQNEYQSSFSIANHSFKTDSNCVRTSNIQRRSSKNETLEITCFSPFSPAEARITLNKILQSTKPFSYL